MSIELEGLEWLIDRLEKIEDTSSIEAAIEWGCLKVEREAKKKAPKGEGELRRSITHEVKNLEGVVFTPLYYAPYVEFGTGIFAEGGKGRQEVPWVYVEGNSSEDRATSKKTFTPKEAEKAAAALRAKGLDARITSGEKPVPFLRPAFYENKEAIYRKIKESILDA